MRRRRLRGCADARIVRVEFVQMAKRRAVKERARIVFARVAHRDDLLAVRRADRHVERRVDAVMRARVLDRARHPFERGERIVLEPEREREMEHDFGIRRSFDRREQPGIDAHHQVAPQRVIAADQAVVSEQPAAAAKRMAVGFLHGRVGRRAHVRDKERRANRTRGLAQVAVVPGGTHAAIDERNLVGLSVPADAEAVAVGRRRAHPRMQALIDQRMLRAKQHGFERNRIAGVGEPAAHREHLRRTRTASASS